MQWKFVTKLTFAPKIILRISTLVITKFILGRKQSDLRLEAAGNKESKYIRKLRKSPTLRKDDDHPTAGYMSMKQADKIDRLNKKYILFDELFIDYGYMAGFELNCVAFRT